jgi:hypothetical protein
MKKILLLTTFFVVTALVLVGLPLETKALKVSNFEHSYYGTWTKKYDNLDTDGITENGAVTIDIYSLSSDGQISSAYVTFDDSEDSYFSTGYIYKKHGKFHIILNYSYLSNDYYMYTFTITGHITKNKINGTYDHWDQYYEEYWGGNIKAYRS